ncbi:MAG TPA: FTR1 family protein [Polyangia bacterium]|jgi:high-affinity iron transporter
MLQALLVTFREGLESLLIVGVITAYLRKTGRASLLRGVRLGLAVSVVTCLVGAYLWQLVPNQPLYEGIAALTAALLVGLLLAQMVRMGRHMKGDIEAKVERISGGASLSERPSLAAVLGIAFVTMLLVTREGLEAVLYLGIQFRMAGSGAAPRIGAGIGLVAAAAVAWTWSRRAARLNLGIVLKVTAMFLTLFLLQLLIYGVHELAESGVIEGSQSFHDATEIAGPDGPVGHVISYSLLAAPLLYLLLSRRAARRRQA